MAEGARLESVYTATYRGFESPLTAIFKEELVRKYGLFFVYCTHRGDEKPRPGFDNWRQPVGQTVNAVSGLPAGRAKRVNPPLTAIFKEELVRKYGLFFRILHTPGTPKTKPGSPGLCTDNTLNCRHAAYVGKVPNVRSPLYRTGRSQPFHLLRNVPARHLIRSTRREANRIA